MRNKVKRRIRESVRKQLVQFPLNHDLVVVARSASADADFKYVDGAVCRSLTVLAHENNSDNADKTL